MTTQFSQISWLIVVLPVASFCLIALAIILAGKTQRFAQAVAPVIIVLALAAALVIAGGALRETLQVNHEREQNAKSDNARFSEHVPAVRTLNVEPSWYESKQDWMAPEGDAPAKAAGQVTEEPRPHTFAKDFTLRVGVLIDPLSAAMMLVVLIVSLLVQIYSYSYMQKDEHPRFNLYMSLFTASMLGLVIAGSLIQLFIFWELVGLCSYLLIGFWYRKPEAARAAIKAFVVTRFGDLGLLFAVIFLWMSYGDLSFSALQQAVGVNSGAAVVPLSAIAILIFFGACGKSAQFPLHIWLPDAMEGPTSVSALIHAATMVAAGIYLVARTFFIFEAAPSSLLVVALVGGFTAFFAATIGLAQSDMKKVMAYSTISQLGYMMMGLGLAAPAAAFFHLTTHAFFKALLFLTAGSVIHAAHTQNIWEMGGLYKKMKVTAITCLVGGLALAGIAPLAGFFSKDKLLESAYAVAVGHQPLLANVISPTLGWVILIMALATVLMTAFYTTRMWALVFLGKPRGHGAEHAHESAPPMLFALIVLAVLAVVAGFGFTHIPGWAGLQWGEENGFELSGVGMLGFGVAVAGILWSYAIYGRKAPATTEADPLRRLGVFYTGMVNLWWVDAFFRWLAGHVVLALAATVRAFDKQVVDGIFVDGTAWITSRIGHTVRRVSAGKLPGQLQYYALVIFILAALMILGISAMEYYQNMGMGVIGR